MKRLVGEFVPKTISEARFQASASTAASMDLVLPRKRREARSCTNRYRKIPKIRTPAECPKALTSRDSFTPPMIMHATHPLFVLFYQPGG